jgi:sulfatase modifying factor 1
MGWRAALLGLAFLAAPALAQPGPDGFDWVTVGSPGNAPYVGFSDPLTPTYGRGGVGYEFNIGRTEVTTGQWMEFLNAAMARPDPLPFAQTFWWDTPVFWGAEADPTYSGPGVRFRLRSNVADAAMLPVGGISWRHAAVMCNWLHNGKVSAHSAFSSGAYDVNTFGPELSHPTFTDQATRSPGARYWIPSLDEYLKAVYYDPHHAGPGVGGWWSRPNGSDTPLVYGPPPSFGGDGTGQANAGFRLPGDAHLNIPLGAYPHVQSPWGLLDTAGGTVEWLEDIWGSTTMYRMIDGSAREVAVSLGLDDLTTWGTASPHSSFSSAGVRLASNVPGPGTLITVTGSCVLLSCQRRRRTLCGKRSSGV